VNLRVFLHEILGIIEHLGSVIPLIDNLMGKRVTSRMVPTVTIMDFMHHSPSFIWSKVPQVGVGMKLGVRFIV